jgi:hypothetical protein
MKWMKCLVVPSISCQNQCTLDRYELHTSFSAHLGRVHRLGTGLDEQEFLIMLGRIDWGCEPNISLPGVPAAQYCTGNT